MDAPTFANVMADCTVVDTRSPLSFAGGTYAVEVKAGRADVGSVRQIYANSKLLGYIPMLVSKGLPMMRLWQPQENWV